jgi:hypothetical protein
MDGCVLSVNGRITRPLSMKAIDRLFVYRITTSVYFIGFNTCAVIYLIYLNVNSGL